MATAEVHSGCLTSRGAVDLQPVSMNNLHSLVVFFQGDGSADRPQELLLVLQAVGGAGGRTRTCSPVVRKLGHHGKTHLYMYIFLEALNIKVYY